MPKIKDAKQLLGLMGALDDGVPTPYSLATISTLVGDGTVTVTFEGDVDDDLNPVPSDDLPLVSLDTYNPLVGDRVLIAEVGDTWVVIDSLAENIPWTALPYAANISDAAGGFDPGQYCRVGGVVWIRGLGKIGVSVANGFDVATLPVGCRMAAVGGNGQAIGSSAVNFSTNGAARLAMTGGGVLHLGTPTATTIPVNGNFTLGCSFLADS